jgi:hypothetical protein
MSLPQETLIELMALADGELEGDAQARVERLVAESDEARQVVEAMRSPAIGTWLRGEAAAAADEHASVADGIADAVMAKLEPAGEREAGGVVRLADVRARRSSRVQMVIAAATATIALAAGIAIYVRDGSAGKEGRAPVASVGTPSVDLQQPPTPPETLAQRPSQGVEVDEVDSPSRGISVFEIPVAGGAAAAANAAGPSSVVIMIEDDQGAK